MKACYDILNKQFKTNIIQSPQSSDINNRLISISSQIERTTYMPTKNNDIHNLLTLYKNLIDSILFEPDLIISIQLEEIECTLIGILTTDICMGNLFQRYILEARNISEPPTLDQLLPNFLTLVMRRELYGNQIFFADFYAYFMKILKKFQIPSCIFIKQVVKKVMCAEFSRNDDLCCVSLEMLPQLLGLFCGSMDNYRFFRKISIIYHGVFQKLPKEYNPEKFSLKFTNTSKNHEGNEGINYDTSYLIFPGGIGQANLYRNDRMVIFGNHQYADIKFPSDDPEIEPVVLLVYNAGSNYYAVDCSQKGYCAIKLNQNRRYELKEQMMMSLGRTILIAIRKIEYMINPSASEEDQEYDLDSNTEVHSKLHLTFLKGPYEEITLSTQERNSQNPKRVHILGRGGRGVCPDILITDQWRSISTKHLVFNYTEGNSWNVVDEISSYGVFLLLKTEVEYSQKIDSQPVRLFSSRMGNRNDVTITILNYALYLKKIN